MKTIYLVRHAHAGWNNANRSDFDRTLSERGRDEAGEIAGRLLKKEVHPEIIISSPASRTIETAGIFGETMGFAEEPVREESGIYSGDVGTMAGLIRSLPDAYRSVMLFGHNPTISMYASWLTGRHLAQMETCGVLRLDLPVKKWSDAKEGSAATAWYLYPKGRQ